MPNSKQQQSLRSGRWIMVVLISLSIGIALAPAAQGQTFQVLHSFTDGADGAYPLGVEMDRAGNLYGPMGGGGHGGVFKLSHLGAGWTVSPLYFFSGGSDGAAPSGLTIAADGTLYGTTEYGGTGSCSRYDIPGCGMVFRLTPPASNCRASYCSWNKTTLYSFQGFPDLQYPAAEVTFDQAGNFYGTAPQGGSRNFGGVYKLARSQGSWAYSVPYSFGGGQDGITPSGSLVADQAGNLYGTTSAGGSNGGGTVFELSPSGAGWAETILHSFHGTTDGEDPYTGLIFDPAGNLYGTTSYGGPSQGGTVFELSPARGFAFSVLYSLPNFYGEGAESESKLVRDQAGNLYGTAIQGGANGGGFVFKLSPVDGGWIYTDLHDFAFSDGAYPLGDLAIDSQGNLYGTTEDGGGPDCSGLGCGVVWEITP